MTRPTLVTQNNQTGQTSSLCHHCTTCAKPISTSCYKKHHVAFCTAPKHPERPEDGLCGFRFNVRSAGGCGKHPYNTGFNRDVRALLRGVEEEQEHGDEEDGQESEGEGQEEELPFDADWKKLREGYKEKGAPREKTKPRKGKVVGKSSVEARWRWS